MTKVELRNVTPLLQAFRNLLLGRKYNSSLRFTDFISARNQPPPNLPGGPHHKLSANYYYTHDARRNVRHPILIADGRPVGKIALGKVESSPMASQTLERVPGKVWHWD